MNRFELSERADDQLIEIFLFGLEAFGEKQAKKYQSELEQVFAKLADFPNMGRNARSMRPGLRRHEHGSHVIFYRQTEQGIMILAVLHGANVRDLPV